MILAIVFVLIAVLLLGLAMLFALEPGSEHIECYFLASFGIIFGAFGYFGIQGSDLMSAEMLAFFVGCCVVVGVVCVAAAANS